MTKRKKTLILNAASNGTATSLWRHPDDNSREFSRSLDFWIEFAQLAERGKLNALFIADHLAPFDIYGGNFEAAAKNGVCISRVDPAAIASAVALHTKNIGLGLTFSTISEHPYHFARRLATLDHLTKGRVGWNIVASYQSSSGRQLLATDGLPEHDARYEKTEEYLDAVYSLLLSSWREDALVADRETGVFVDPDRIRTIDHKGKFFDIKGPSITEPSPQSFPVIIQAGTSKRGKLFAAENAEAVFVNLHDPSRLKGNIADTRKLAKEKFGRDPTSIKFIVPISPIIGKTQEEALRKFEELEKYVLPDYGAVMFGGISDIDLAQYDWDELVIPKSKTNAIVSSTEALVNKGGVAQTKRQIVETLTNSGKTFVGTVEHIADKIEEFVDVSDIDGINFGFQASFPDGLKDIVELLVPELRRRGLFWDDYPVDGGTLRENLYGVKGQTFLEKSHPAHNLKWKAGVSKQEFESQLEDYKEIRNKRRADALASA